MAKTGKSLMQRTLAVLKEKGCLYQKTEVWNPFAHRRQDLFGFIDILAVYPDSVRPVGIQVCDKGSVNQHIEKIKSTESYKRWLTVGRIEIWSWHCVCMIKTDGKKSKVKEWQYEIIEVKE